MEEQIIKIPTKEELENTYIKTFRMQATGADGQTTRVSVPRDVVRKEAKKHKMTIEEFLEKFYIEWRYNSFPGVYGMFIPIEEKEIINVSKEPDQMP